jgi:hypothetical protein
MVWQAILRNPKTAGAVIKKVVDKVFNKGKVSDTITNLTGKYNIGSANKIKNKASIARIKNMSFRIQQTGKKLGDTMDKLGKK